MMLSRLPYIPLLCALALACSDEDPIGGSADTGAIENDSGQLDASDSPDSGGIDAEVVRPDAATDSGVDSGVGDTGPNVNNPNNAMLDSDCDGLSDAEEFSTVYADGRRTDPNNPDTDGDGILDGVEVGRTTGVTGTNCMFAGDADPATTTLPTLADSDSDMIPDGVEDLNRNGRVDAGESDPRLRDSDGDGLADGIEDANQNGARDPGETNPSARDSDGDGIGDGVEDANRNGTVDAGETDPRATDSDNDMLADGDEDTNHNGVTEQFETNPRTPDTDCDGLSDFAELTQHMTSPLVPDTDGDGVPDGVELGVTTPIAGTNCPGLVVDADPTSTTDPTARDSDGDGLPDGVEDADGNGRVDAGETNPGNADSDGDTVPDGDEVLSGFDPLDPADPPMGQIPGIVQICSTNNLRVVSFTNATAWTLATETQFTYTPVAVSGAMNIEVAAIDSGADAISGFILRMPLLAGATNISAQAQAVESRFGAAAAGQQLVYNVRLSGRQITSHDGFPTSVSAVEDITSNSGGRNASAVRNALLQMVTGLPAGSFAGLPTNTGNNATQYVFSYQVLLRPTELVVLGAVLARGPYDDVADNRSVIVSDLTNGTSLAVADARRDKDCDPFNGQGAAVADFIWMSDISGSTDDDRGRISQAATTIVNALAQANVDFRMGVVTHMENDIRLGANQGGALRGAGFTRDPGTFASYLGVPAGVTPDGCEFGLTAAGNAVRRALPRSAVGVEDPRRFRANATPVVVYISDEFAEEVANTGCYGFNPGCATNVGDYWSSNNNAVCSAAPNQACIDSIALPFVNQIRNEGGLAFAQVIVPNAAATNCTGYACPGGQAANEPGRGYTEVVNATGGAFYSPCNNNPGQALQAIVAAVAGAASQYTLSGQPISSTLRVGVVRQSGPMAGQVQIVPRDKDDGFDYDPANNAIFFRGTTYRPTQGEPVVVSYRNWQPPEPPCGPCLANQVCDPQLGVCTCDAAVCAACGPNQVCDQDCNCVCGADCNGNCGAGQVCNQATCQCECPADCGGRCGPGQVCNPTTCTCDCGPDCGGACAANPNLVCNQAACNCQCPATGTCPSPNQVWNQSTCDCSCSPTCDDACIGNQVCNPANNCACECPLDCGGCPDNTICNATSCQCECAPNCNDSCSGNQVCDPTNNCGCVCPADCGGCAANEICDPLNCVCVGGV